MFILLGLLILDLASRKFLARRKPFAVLAFSTNSIDHGKPSSYGRIFNGTAKESDSSDEAEKTPVTPEPDEEDRLLEEKRKLLNRLPEIEAEISKTKRLFRRVIKTITLSPCPAEDTDDLVREGRLFHNAVNWDRVGANRRQMPDHNPATGHETAYMIEIRRHSGDADYKEYYPEKLIRVIGGEKEVWDKQTFTLQQIEQVFKSLGKELEVDKDYKFFYHGQSSSGEPRLMIVMAEVRPQRVGFTFNGEQVFKANDIIFLKTKPDTTRFKEKDLI